MTPKPDLSRADSVRQRRTSQPHSQPVSHRTTKMTGQAYRSETMYLPFELRTMARKTPTRMAKVPRRNSYDIAFSLGRTGVRAPAPSLSIPRLGTRWVSAALTLLLGFLLFVMWTASTFTVKAASVRGNQRLGEADVTAMLGMVGQPIFKAVPARIEANLRTAFPDLASVKVRVGLPNHVKVDVVERMPTLAWYQGEAVTWIDASGVAFLPRGEVQGLIQVAANGTPPKVQEDPAKPLYDQVFIAPEMVQAMATLYPYVPGGAPMIYDPQYGMGWQDPRGWSVYFGQNTQDIPMKLAAYQTIEDTFTQQGIQPTLISVEYLDAPFYK
jgi:hypothetical protein